MVQPFFAFSIIILYMFQGHMYLFVHYICFYSNIFGFETKVSYDLNQKLSLSL